MAHKPTYPYPYPMPTSNSKTHTPTQQAEKGVKTPPGPPLTTPDGRQKIDPPHKAQAHKPTQPTKANNRSTTHQGDSQTEPPKHKLPPPNAATQQVQIKMMSTTSHPPYQQHAPICEHDSDPNRTPQKCSKANVLLATLNMTGRSHTTTTGRNQISKWTDIHRVLRQKQISILCLQETHLEAHHITDIEKPLVNVLRYITQLTHTIQAHLPELYLS
jgi:hypothetical protein